MTYIKILWDDNSIAHVQSTIDLNDSQIKTLCSFPPYYDELELIVEKDGHHIQVIKCFGITNNIISQLTELQFDELVYESDYNGIEWLTNRIDYDKNL